MADILAVNESTAFQTSPETTNAMGYKSSRGPIEAHVVDKKGHPLFYLPKEDANGKAI